MNQTARRVLLNAATEARHRAARLQEQRDRERAQLQATQAAYEDAADEAQALQEELEASR